MFRNHVNIISCIINRMMNSFCKMPNIVTGIKKITYHSLGESHIINGIVIWASFLKSRTE